MPSHLQSLQNLYTSALDFPSLEERSAYLDEACGDNSELRSEVESLLSVRERAEGFLQPLIPQLHPTQLMAPSDETPKTIGPYIIREQLGEGGFGLVYAAEQTEPVRRMVALKVIKMGMDTKEVLARFEAEKQALAMMDHAHIAKVFDVGTTDTGRPYS
jgi:hypothetical protein